MNTPLSKEVFSGGLTTPYKTRKTRKPLPTKRRRSLGKKASPLSGLTRRRLRGLTRQKGGGVVAPSPIRIAKPGAAYKPRKKPKAY